MTRWTHPGKTTIRTATALVMAVALLGAVAATRGTLAEEVAEARAFVADGQRALARDDRGAAVLSLERARWVAPRAPFVREALAVATVEDTPTPLRRVAHFLTPREWSALATTFGWISGLGIALVVLGWRSRSTLWVALAAGVAFVVGMGGTMESNASAPGVVIGSDIHLLVAPYSNATSSRALPAGTVVIVGSHYDGFVRVEDGAGVTGWVPRAHIERVAGTEG